MLLKNVAIGLAAFAGVASAAKSQNWVAAIGTNFMNDIDAKHGLFSGSVSTADKCGGCEVFTSASHPIHNVTGLYFDPNDSSLGLNFYSDHCRKGSWLGWFKTRNSPSYNMKFSNSDCKKYQKANSFKVCWWTKPANGA
ncbi:hypothetical protein BJ138DRAFT_1148927 [Hygrophoropsis aurantiaca]|uniref:Uncharacterized protein n=1 Tax=Hygrophoropsis aurantiaca TaxID=72124 RepID=A0ACB8AG19_9AGAM|nr:hypothetical protein BJ138DRAFT_1148927 [Hygrophoropsis aurantiaca]